MSSTATLEYQATAQGPVTPANLEAAMAAVPLFTDAIAIQTGCTLVSDTTTLAGSTASRTIVYDIATAEFEQNFPAGTDQTAPFNGLYTPALSSGLESFIIEIPVVIA